MVDRTKTETTSRKTSPSGEKWSLAPRRMLSGTKTRQIGKVGAVIMAEPAMCPAVPCDHELRSSSVVESLRQCSHAPTGEAHVRGYKPKTPTADGNQARGGGPR